MAAKKVTRRKPRLTRKKREEKGFWDDAPIISMYTRQQAIDDGVLVDVSEVAKSEYGINLPLAFTRAVWDEYITPDPRSEGWGQSIRGRLHDALYMLLPHLKHVTSDQKWIDKFNRDGSVTFYYKLWFVLKEKQRREIQLKVVISLDENYRPVCTIMKPGED
jgi:hypothetical protein